MLRLALAALAFATLIGFAPQIAARTGLAAWYVRRAASNVRGTIELDSVRLSWLSAPQLSGVELRDDRGRLLVSAPSVRLDRSLLSLALHHSDLGTITLDQPSIEMIAAGDETDLERALAAFLDTPSTGPTRTSMKVAITGGMLTLHDADIDQRWIVSDLRADVDVPADRRAPIKFDGNGQIGDPGTQSRLGVAVAWRTGSGGPGAAPQLQVEVKADALPAAALATILRRFEPGLRFDGLLKGDLAIGWDDTKADAHVLSIQGHVTGHDVAVVDPRLGKDRLELAEVDLPCKLTWAGGRVASDNTRLRCNLGQIHLDGPLDLSVDPAVLLKSAGLTFSCDIDLARLARMLPNVIRRQPGTRIDSGRLAASVRSAAGPDGVTWTGSLRAVDLRGEHLGQPVAWASPVSAEFAIRQGADALPLIDKFNLTAEFGRLEATGDGQQLTLGGTLDLSLLTRRLGQFVDLGAIQPSGQASGQISVRRERGGAFNLNGGGAVHDLSLPLAGATFREADVQLRLSAAGRMNGPACRIDSAGVHLSAGADGVDLDLAEPVADLALCRDGYMKASVRGDLARWKGWLGQFVTIPADWQASGSVDGEARVRINAKGAEADSARLTLANLRFAGAGLNVAEPQFTLKPGTLKWERQSGHIEASDVQLICPTLTVQIVTVSAKPGQGGGIAVSGRGRVQGDAARLQRWLPALSSEPVAGALDGPFQFSVEGDRLGGGIELSFTGLTLGDPAAPVWTEPLVRLTAKGGFDPTADQITLDEFKVEASAAGCTASGHVANLRTARDLLLTGELSYDLEKWEPQLRGFIGKDARLAGRGVRPFRIEGPLSPPAAAGAGVPSPLVGLKGEAGLGWSGAQAFGCVVGPAEVKAKMLGDGWVRFQRIEATFNHGKLKVEPYIRLTPGAAVLAFGKGTGVERAKITPALSHGSLGYAVPVFAGIHDAEGEVSVVIDGGQVPLANPAKADVWGRFVIHSARVTSGPLLQELSVLLRAPPTLSLPREMAVPFRLVNGRVYHQNLDLPLGEFTVRTSGSVGLDGSLDLIAEMPTPPKWLGKSVPKSAQTIRLPIKGTIHSPKIDERALEQAAGQYIKDAAGDALKREAEKGLQKWFHPPKK